KAIREGKDSSLQLLPDPQHPWIIVSTNLLVDRRQRRPNRQLARRGNGSGLVRRLVPVVADTVLTIPFQSGGGPESLVFWPSDAYIPGRQSGVSRSDRPSYSGSGHGIPAGNWTHGRGRGKLPRAILERLGELPRHAFTAFAHRTAK